VEKGVAVGGGGADGDRSFQGISAIIHVKRLQSRISNDTYEERLENGRSRGQHGGGEGPPGAKVS